MTTPDHSDDDRLWAALRSAVAAERDLEVPAEAVSAALAAFDLVRLDAELAVLVDDSLVREGPVMRSDEAEVRLVTFSSARLTIDLDIAGDVITGRLEPAGTSEVEVQEVGSDDELVTRTAPVDDAGRFRLVVGPGSFRLRFPLGDAAISTGWIPR